MHRPPKGKYLGDDKLGTVGPLANAWTVVSGALLLLCLPRAAAADEMITDRPDRAEAAETVGRGHIQVEMGAGLDHDSAADNGTTLSTPTKLRFGLVDALEFHLETEGFALQLGGDDFDGQASSGVSDLDVGFKWTFFRPAEAGWLSAGGLLLSLTGPTGSPGFSSGQPGLSTVLALGIDLPGDFELGVNGGLTFELGSNDGAELGFVAAAAIGHPLSPISPDLGAFFELFSEGGFGAAGEALLGMDAGLTYAVTQNLQLDLALYGGVAAGNPVMGAGLGFSYRI